MEVVWRMNKTKSVFCFCFILFGEFSLTYFFRYWFCSNAAEFCCRFFFSLYTSFNKSDSLWTKHRLVSAICIMRFSSFILFNDGFGVGFSLLVLVVRASDASHTCHDIHHDKFNLYLNWTWYTFAPILSSLVFGLPFTFHMKLIYAFLLRICKIIS